MFASWQLWSHFCASPLWPCESVKLFAKTQFLPFIFDTVPYNIVFVRRNSMCSNHHAASFFIRYLIKMWCINLFSIPDNPSISCTIIRLSLSSNMDAITIEVLSIVVERWGLVHTSCSINLRPSWVPVLEKCYAGYGRAMMTLKITWYSWTL